MQSLFPMVQIEINEHREDANRTYVIRKKFDRHCIGYIGAEHVSRRIDSIFLFKLQFSRLLITGTGGPWRRTALKGTRTSFRGAVLLAYGIGPFHSRVIARNQSFLVKLKGRQIDSFGSFSLKISQSHSKMVTPSQKHPTNHASHEFKENMDLQSMLD